jgi:class 3 adenylate cyclase/predicted ATPase/DNA polymerase III delta prime subunit
MTQLEQLLRGLGLDKYHDIFKQSAIDVDILPELSDADLRELEIPLGDRRRILKAAAELKAGASSPVSRSFGAERRQVTVMFCDLVGSTALSTQMDAEELRDLLRAYQDACMDAVKRYAGTVARAYGDGLLIYFGYPVAHDDEAARAVLAGFDIIDSISRLPANSRLSAENSLKVRIGIHTGQVVVGGIRPDDTLDPMGITGDAPNIAARLQELADPNGIVISKVTHGLAGEVAHYEPLGEHELKGLPAPMTLFAPSPQRGDYQPATEPGAAGGDAILGRETYLDRLTVAWNHFTQGKTRAVLISGPPGIGKSRLMTSLARDLAQREVRPIKLRCSSMHMQSPFFPVADLFTRELGIAPDDPVDERLRKLQGLVDRAGLDRQTAMGLLVPILSIPATDEYPKIEMPAEQRIAQTIDAIIRCLVALSDGAQPALMFEDLHWMDSSTMSILRRLIEAPSEQSIFVVATFRPEFRSPWNETPSVDTMTLSQLDADASRELIRRVAGDTTLGDDIVEHIVATTDGVPLFVEELTKSVIEAQSLGELPTDLTTERLAVTSIPASLQDSLLARLDRLGEAKRVAQLGATIGREFTYQLLASIADMVDDTLQRLLNRLIGAELIFSTGEIGYERFVFKHALIQGAAYSTLLRSDQKSYHRRIAEGIAREAEESGIPQPLLLAHHYTEAGDLREAIPQWFAAGEHALERHAILETINQLNTGLELITRLEDTPEKALLELKFLSAIAMPIATAKGYTAPELHATLERAGALCQQLDNPPQLFPVLHGMVKFYQAQADHERTESLGRELLKIAEDADDLSMRIEAHRNIGMSYALSGNFTESVRHCDDALALYQPELHRSHALHYAVDPAVVALSFSAYSKWALGLIDEATEQARRAMEYAAEIEHPYSEAFALSITATVHQLRQEPQQTLGFGQQAIEISKRHGFPYWIGWAAVPLGWALCKLGQHEQGLATMQQGLGGYQAAGVLAGRPMRQCLLAEALQMSGEVAQALETVQQTAALPELQLDMYHSEVQRLRGDLELAADPAHTDIARSAYEAALAVARDKQATTFELRTLVSLVKLDILERHDPSPALDDLRRVYASFDQGLDTPDLMAANALLQAAS